MVSRYPLRFAITLGCTCLLLVFCLLLAGTFAKAATGENAEDPYVYVFGEQAEFVKIDLRDLQVTAKWVLAHVDGLGGELPAYHSATSAHALPGSWPTGNVLYESDTQRIFVAVPGEMSDDGHFSKYSVLVIRIPDFELLGKISFPEQVNGLPVIALSSERKELFASYIIDQSGPQLVSSLDIYSTDTLKKLQNIRETLERSKYITGARFNNQFRDNAYVSAGGRSIYEGGSSILWRLTLVGDHVTKENLDPKYSGLISGGRVLRIEKDPSGNARFVSVFDLNSNSVVGSKTRVPLVGNLFLSPDGKKIVLQEVRIDQEQVAAGGTKGVGYLTGQFTVYKVADGTEIRTLNLPALAGKIESHRLLCVSPDGEHLIFQAGVRALFDVALTGSSGARPIPVHMMLGDSPKCVFTTEPAGSTN